LKANELTVEREHKSAKSAGKSAQAPENTADVLCTLVHGESLDGGTIWDAGESASNAANGSRNRQSLPSDTRTATFPAANMRHYIMGVNTVTDY